MQEDLKDISLHLVLSVTDHKTEKVLYEFLEDAQIPMRYYCHAQGTADSEVLRLCGLGESDRVITTWVLPHRVMKPFFEKMNRALHLKKRGHGIAVSIPLTGVQMYFAKFMSHQELQAYKEKYDQEVRRMAEETIFSMVVVTVNQGFSDEVIDTAKKAGAKGGTIIRGRRVGLDSAIKFWGISLQEEQEIIFMIVPKTMKKDIMAAIGKAYGLKTPAQGLVLSLPVSDAIGLEI